MRRLACISILLALAMHGAGALAQELPPPGLYRVDNLTEIAQQAGSLEAATTFEDDGASGDQASHSVVGGVDGGTTVHKGSAPLTQCVKPGAPVIPLAPDKSMCKNQQTRRSAQGVVHVASCPAGKLTLSIRRLDARTWEYLTEMDMAGGAAFDLEQNRTMLETVAQHAVLPEERARAASMLAELPRRQAQMSRERAAAEAALRQAAAKARTPQEAAAARQAIARLHGQAPTRIVDRTRLTRIADRCTSP